MPPRAVIYDNGNVDISKDWLIEYGQLKIEVPRGFISDGNSVPWFFRRIIPTYGRNTLAGIVHDWLYAEPFIYGLAGQTIKIDRKFADRVRLDICVKCSVPWYQRILSYLGLRIGGWFSWRRHRKNNKYKSGGVAG